MTHSSQLYFVGLAAVLVAGLAGCGNTAYEIQPDPSSINGGSPEVDSNEIMPASNGNEAVGDTIKELVTKIDEGKTDQEAAPNDSTSMTTDPTPTPDPAPDTTGGVSDSAASAPDPVTGVPQDPPPMVEAKKDSIWQVTPPSSGDDTPKVEAAKEIRVEVKPPTPPPPVTDTIFARGNLIY